MKALIRLLLYEQSDQGLHCFPRPICSKTLDHYGLHENVYNHVADIYRISILNVPWENVRTISVVPYQRIQLTKYQIS